VNEHLEKFHADLFSRFEGISAGKNQECKKD